MANNKKSFWDEGFEWLGTAYNTASAWLGSLPSSNDNKGMLGHSGGYAELSDADKQQLVEEGKGGIHEHNIFLNESLQRKHGFGRDDGGDGWSFWSKAKDYATTAGEYIDKGVGYVRKPLDWLKSGFEALPKPLQDWTKGRLGLTNPTRARVNLPTASSKPLNMNFGDSPRANFIRGQNIGFRGAGQTYANDPIAAGLINDAALNERIRAIANEQRYQNQKGTPTIDVAEAKYAINPKLSKENFKEVV